jgi:hypothetical protein
VRTPEVRSDEGGRGFLLGARAIIIAIILIH